MQGVGFWSSHESTRRTDLRKALRRVEWSSYWISTVPSALLDRWIYAVHGKDPFTSFAGRIKS